ncbi:Dirigent protein 21 [Sesamum angolense]|uniref:Dirigent protein n=1 Tax=Sesamum angolense TaxID=2727404 RepID=A0AAE1WY42_9LAMI|nr:Dirigent protein 21 [Sesamum angolense]
MAKVLISLILIVIISSLSAGILPSGYARNIPHTHRSRIANRNETTAIVLHFYVQDLLAGENKTVYEVARADITSNSTTSFGQVRVFDDLMTAGPDYNSEPIGRAQGLVTSADLAVSAFAMNLNFVFTSGRFNGSTISVLGRNQILEQQRELTVVGGTGVFRFARGYAIASTYSYDAETQNGVLEYTLYVGGSSSSNVNAGV